MALITKEAEERIINLLVSEGLADARLVGQFMQTVSEGSILTKLKEQKIISDDMVARATAAIVGVHYVELKNITIDQDILSLIHLHFFLLYHKPFP